MSITLKPAMPRPLANALRSGFFSATGLVGILRITFFTGPRLLLTSRLSLKIAVMMILLCSPALIFCAMMTVPQLLFQSPQQQGYYYFAETLNQDPVTWLIFSLTGLCAVAALALPATEPQRLSAIRY